MSEAVRYEDLTRLLQRLGFVYQRVAGSHLNYEKKAADALIMLPDHEARAFLRPQHLAVVRRYLDEKGLFSRDEFDLWTAETTLAANDALHPSKGERSEKGRS